MFIILLKFSGKRDRTGQHMDAHKEWLKRGFDEGVFLLAGSLEPAMGGGILANNTSRAELEQRVQADPFVIEKVVAAEIYELDPGKADPRLEFLVS